MPIGNVSNSGPKRDNYRPPWVKDKDSDAPPPWTQRKLRPVESPAKNLEEDAPTSSLPAGKPLKPVLKKQSTIRAAENGSSEPVEEKLIKPSSVKLTTPSRAAFTKSALKSIDKIPKLEGKLSLDDNTKDKDEINPVEKISIEIKPVEKIPEKPALRSVRTIDDKAKEKSVTIVDKKPIEKNGLTKPNSFINEKPQTKVTPNYKIPSKSTTTNDKPANKTTVNDKGPVKVTPNYKIPSKTAKSIVSEKSPEKNTIVNEKPAEKNTFVNEKPTEKSKDSVKKQIPEKPKTPIPEKPPNEKATPKSTIKEPPSKPITKTVEKPVVQEKEEESTMATKPPASKLPPRKPSLQKQPSKDEIGSVKKWRDPLHERVKENIDKTLANEIPKGHTLMKNESLRSLLKPTPPPMPPPMPPKMPPPPEFKKDPIDPTKLKKLEQLRSRPRRRPDWSDMMKEVEDGKKLKHVVCNDRSSPIITTTALVKNKGQFIFESEKPNSHNILLKEINKGVKLKKVKTNDRSKPNLEGLRKFRRQMTIEEQVQKSMSQANLAASPSGVFVPDAAVAAAPEEDEIDEMDDIDKVRDDLQSTKQLLAIELRNKEAQERENKRLLTRIQNLEAELARERAIVRQEQHKTVISVTDAYDERLVNSLKSEVEKTKENADNLEKQYLQAAEDRDTALTELEEVKRRNAELEKKLEQALSGIMPTNMGSRRSSHAIKQLSVTKDDSFEEEEESEPEEEESEEKKQKRMEKEVRNMRNRIRHLKEKQDHMKRERMGFKMCLKNQQAALKDEKRKYKELKREVDKMAAMMKEVGSDDEDDEEEEEESEDEKKSESEEEETETETEQDTESETESESEPEDAPLPKKKENLSTRLKRHETRVNALKKGNTLLMANVDRMKDDVLKQREESMSLKKELDSLIDDLE